LITTLQFAARASLITTLQIGARASLITTPQIAARASLIATLQMGMSVGASALILQSFILVRSRGCFDRPDVVAETSVIVCKNDVFKMHL
jgi:hypothetical protein